jgi:membrane fusion protein, multidrug efflux system
MESRDDRQSEAVKDPAAPQALPPRAQQGSPLPPANSGASPDPDSAAATHPAPHHPPSHSWLKWLLLGVAVVGLAVGGYFALPWVDTALNTVSTDDAYVNGHVTFVAPRVAGQVSQVLVDDNYRVKKGDVLVRLDREPYQVQVAIKQAAVAAAETDLAAAKAQVQGLVGQTRANRFKLEHAIEDVNTQIANLHAAVATLDSRKATLDLAKSNLKRGEDLAPNGISKEELDQRRQTVKVDAAAVDQALQQVYAIRVGLGLPTTPEEDVFLSIGATTPGLLAAPMGQGPLLAAAAILPQRTDDLTRVRPQLDQNFSAVREALGALVQSAAQFGYFPTSWNANPKEAIEAFYKQDPEGNLDRIYARLIPEAPPVKQAEAKLLQAQKDLAQAELNLSYCDVVSETDGVVTRRNVNPGNNVQVGQSLMAVRSLTEIWIDANFKETQLADLRIGQRVRCEVDMYGSKQEFEGRITGFTMGTGETLALLPPQNATGNYVKIVQRLPVRIELTDYDPEKVPLFVGLSVTPYVYYKEPAAGPHAGDRLQPPKPLPQSPTVGLAVGLAGAAGLQSPKSLPQGPTAPQR